MHIYTLKVEGPEGAMREAAAAVLDAVWPVMQLLSDGLSHPWEAYLEPLRDDPRLVSIEPGALHFHFHGFDGEIGFYDGVCLRWFALTIAAIPTRLDAALAPLRVVAVGVPALHDVLAQPRTRVMRLGSALVEVDAYGDEVLLMSDGIHETVEGEQAVLARAFAASDRTDDPVEGYLRPSDQVRERFLGELPGAKGEALERLAWFIGHQAFPGPLAAALLDRAADAPHQVGQAMARLGGRAAIASAVEQGLRDPRRPVRTAALRAVSPLVQRGSLAAGDAVAWLLAALARSEDERVVAAEALGHFDLGDDRERVVHALCGLAGREPEVEYSAALALFNLHRNGGASSAVREFFAKVALRGGPGKGLAEVALRLP